MVLDTTGAFTPRPDPCEPSLTGLEELADEGRYCPLECLLLDLRDGAADEGRVDDFRLARRSPSRAALSALLFFVRVVSVARCVGCFVIYVWPARNLGPK